MKILFLSLTLALGTSGPALAQNERDILGLDVADVPINRRPRPIQDRYQTAPIPLPAPAGGEPDRSIPIPPGPAHPIQVSAVNDASLANQLKVAVIEAHRSVLVSLRLLIPLGGSVYDPKNKTGLAGITAALMTEGAGNLDSRQFADALADIGAREFAVAAGGDALAISVRVTKEHMNEALRLISAMVRSPQLPAKEFDRIKAKALAELDQAKGIPDSQAGKRLYAGIFGDHPYGRSASERSINNITLADARKFQARLRPEGAILSAGGDVTLEQLRVSALENFGSWIAQPSKSIPKMPAVKGASLQSPPSESSARERGLTIEVIDMPGSSQSAIRAGHLSIKRDNPDFFPVIVMNFILGGDSEIGRLGANIRETHGWTYGIESSIDSPKQAGIFSIETDVDTPSTADAVKEILKEMSRLQTDPVPIQELEARKRYMNGFFLLRQQTVQSLSKQAQGVKFNGLPSDTLQRYRDQVNAVTVEDVQRAARKYLHPGQLMIAIAGDATKIAPELAQIAPVRVYDVDGREIAHAKSGLMAAAE